MKSKGSYGVGVKGGMLLNCVHRNAMFGPILVCVILEYSRFLMRKISRHFARRSSPWMLDAMALSEVA